MMVRRRGGRYSVEWFGYRDKTTRNTPPKEEIEEKPIETDLSNHKEIFLRGLLESPSLIRKNKSSEPEEESLIVKPVSLGNVDIIRSLSEYRGNNIRTIEQAELAILLSKTHFKALIEAHDKVGKLWLDRGSGIDESMNVLPQSKSPVIEEQEENMPVETVKVVGLRKIPNQPLGLTVATDEHGQLVVARILSGGTVDKQGLLSIGDVLLEVDGVPLDSAEQLKEAAGKATDRVTLTVGPNVKEKNAQLNNKLSCYVRALFDYDPTNDSLLPCKELGLEFVHGDILQVSDRKDPNWWQANLVENPQKVGLIPSPELEERRKAYVPPEADFVHKISICGARVSRKKKKFAYESRSCVGQLDGAELALYEEVARTPPFLRRVLALVGARGVGRRSLKNKMIQEHPERFSAVIPHTSRPPRPLEENGTSYWFVSHDEMQRDALAGRFLEYGEHNGYLYGTHLDSIRAVIKEGKMCILDCAPSSLKLLHNSGEFLPYVVFIGASGMEQLKTLTHSSRNLMFDRQSSIRYSSRRARTLESLASLYEEEDLKTTLEEGASLQRKYDKYIDETIINENLDTTYSKIMNSLHKLSTEHQWVPVSWIY